MNTREAPTGGDWLHLADVARDLGFGVKRFGRADLQRLGIPFVDRGLERESWSIRVSRAAYSAWKLRAGAPQNNWASTCSHEVREKVKEV